MNELIKSSSIILINLIKDLGGQARFVGGAVRDSIIGVPFHDIDLATNLDTKILLSEEVKNIASSRTDHFSVHPTGIDHGTITVNINNDIFQITTTRKDVSCDGRRAVTSFTNYWIEDAARRDFTINGFYMDIDGNIYDYFNGLADIKEGIIRFIGDLERRIAEDYLRILRYFRFYGRFSYKFKECSNDIPLIVKNEIDEYNLRVIRDLAPKMEVLSSERIKEEIFGIISGKFWKDILKLMNSSGVLNYCRADINIDNLDLEFDSSYFITAIDRFSFIIASAAIDKVCLSLKLSKKERNRMIYLNKCEMKYETESDVITALVYYQDYDKVLFDLYKNNCAMVHYLRSVRDLYLDKEFPIKAVDIMPFCRSNKIALILKELRLIWARNHGLLTKNDCIKIAIEICSQKN